MKNDLFFSSIHDILALEPSERAHQEFEIALGEKSYTLEVINQTSLATSVKQINELLYLRCNSEPFFHWRTRQESVIGFGDLLENYSFEESTLLESINHLAVLPRFHSLPFFINCNFFDQEDWKNWKFPKLLLPRVLIKLDHQQKQIDSLTFYRLRDSIDTPKKSHKEPFSPALRESKKYTFTSEPKERLGQKKENWQKQIGAILREIEDTGKETSKVVLARTLELNADHPFDPLTFFNHLSQQSDREKLTHFYLECNKLSFLGFSPENLLKSNGAEVSIDAIAGTSKRSTNKEEDEHLAQELFRSAKDQREHQSVISEIENYCESLGRLQKSTQEILKLSKVQHLKTPLKISLEKNDKLSILNLAKTLHPTPAVGGTPRNEALAVISKTESFERGLYAGAIGFQHNHQDHFIVAIRSMLNMNHSKILLYAGAGIVEGSDAAQEWEETDIKLNSFLPAEYIKDSQTEAKTKESEII